MTGTNHFLVGAGIGLSVASPIIALPLAFMSHFVLDALPHYGAPFDEKAGKRPPLFGYVTSIDTPIGFALLLAAAITQPWLVPACMVLALSPDFVWIYKYVFKEDFGKLPPTKKGPISQFHKDIQRYERSWGIYVEMIFALIVGALVFSLL